MNNKVIFKGSENVLLLKKIERLRFDVWGRLINPEAAEARFSLDRFDHEGWHVVYFSIIRNFALRIYRTSCRASRYQNSFPYRQAHSRLWRPSFEILRFLTQLLTFPSEMVLKV